jgi:hypothetical protein
VTLGVGAPGRNCWRRVSLIQPDHHHPSAAACELRRAFSRGPTPEAAALLLRELDGGLAWDTATRAVAEGIAKRFGPDNQTIARGIGSSRKARVWPGILLGLMLYVMAQP